MPHRRADGTDIDKFPELRGAELQDGDEAAMDVTAEDYVPPRPRWSDEAVFPSIREDVAALTEDPGLGHLSAQVRSALARMIDRSDTPRAVEPEAVENLLETLRTRLRAEAVTIVPGTESEVASQMLAALPRARSTRSADVIGPCYDTGGLTAWLGITKQAIEKRRRRHQLLGLQQEGRWAYPAWQFTATGQTIPGLTAVLTVLSPGTTDSWAWALWMSARLPEQLEGKSVWQWLRDGGSVDEAVSLARSDAASWSAA